jgi:hypothetical protein
MNSFHSGYLLAMCLNIHAGVLTWIAGGLLTLAVIVLLSRFLQIRRFVASVLMRLR